MSPDARNRVTGRIHAVIAEEALAVEDAVAILDWMTRCYFTDWLAHRNDALPTPPTDTVTPVTTEPAPC